jgi:uncharacterized RmlC-like cupin family protein
MTEQAKSSAHGVKIVRGASLQETFGGSASATGRATAFDFAGSEGAKTWIGTVTYQPGAVTGGHHHGRHEVAVYVVKGRCEIRWGERLEFAADIGPGDFAYFAPNVPHQETNLSATETLEFVVIRSDGERIAIPLVIEPAAEPEHLF